MDLIIATVLFALVFAGFYGFVTSLLVEPEDRSLAQQAALIGAALSERRSPLQVIDAQQIDITKLGNISDLQYNELKAKLGIKDDFCLYFEDGQGNLVEISPGKKSIGKGTLGDNAVLITGGKEIPCGA